MENQETCLRCGSTFGSGFHICASRSFVIHPKALIESRRIANPLDRLTFGEMMEIYDEDMEEDQRRTEAFMEEHGREYLSGPLSHRVELQTVSGLGFQGGIDVWAIETDGSTTADLEEVLDFLNLDLVLPLSPRKDEIYLCRMVSVNSNGIKYVWSINRLEFDSTWIASTWS